MIVFASAACAALLAPAAQAQFLSYDEVLTHISGRWTFPFRVEAGGPLVFDCDRRALVITVDPVGSGYRYESWVEGDDAYRFSRHQQDLPNVASDRSPSNALHVTYENEARRDPNGNLISFYLYMRSPDAFVWTRSHMNFADKYPDWTRCPDELVS